MSHFKVKNRFEREKLQLSMRCDNTLSDMINLHSYMRTCAMNKWSWLKYADLILISSSYFASVSTTVKTTDPYVIVHSSRNNLYPLKIAGKDDYVTSCGIGL